MILDATDTTFRVHGLVQTVERVRAEQKGRDDGARDRALVRLAAIFPDAFNDPSAWPLCRQLLPHQRALTARLGPDHENAELPRLLNTAGNFLQDSGDAAGALPLYRRALESSERLLGPEHPATLTTRNNIAFCTAERGDARTALRLFEALLPDQERVLGSDHPNTLTIRKWIDDLSGG
jgi:tetratricopeptide (TPR) repeat protein